MTARLRDMETFDAIFGLHSRLHSWGENVAKNVAVGYGRQLVSGRDDMTICIHRK